MQASIFSDQSLAWSGCHEKLRTFGHANNPAGKTAG
jgi:hypothetical protein